MTSIGRNILATLLDIKMLVNRLFAYLKIFWRRVLRSTILAIKALEKILESQHEIIKK